MMMKKHWILATWVFAGTGAVGVGAGSTVNLKGSDTLFDFTQAVIAACPGTMGPYSGTGSDNGQAAMLAGTQQVAPMSRFLNNGACTGTGASPTTSEGLVVALDSVAVVGASQTFGSAACNGTSNGACDPTFQPTTGAAFDTTVAGYMLNGWRDVLRVLLAGLTHDVTATDATAWAARDCNSAIRVALANNYGSLFENNCSAPAGSASGGNCSQVLHIFRRDDFSGPTDTVVSLLNLPGIVYPETTVNGTVQHTGADPFCNAVRPAFVFASPPTCLQGSDATWDPTSKNVGTGCTKENAVYRSTMQDNDPIRRSCFGSGTSLPGVLPAEDNCSHSGDLGLVLTMNDVPEAAPRTNADRYNATQCAKGKFASVTFPDVYDAISQGKQICSRGLLCPNGDVCTNTGGCLAPADPTGNPQCLASKLTTSATVVSTLAVPLVNPKLPGVNDGRSYNQHLYVTTGASAGAYQSNGFASPLSVTGAFYRIHTDHTLAPASDAGAGPTCRLPNMTDQIGCLVSASPCSIGYAGLQALTSNPNAQGIKIHKQSPLPLCVQSNFLYPFSHKFYLNTLTGFGNVTGQELALTGCETDLAQGSTTPSGVVTSAVAAAGFIQIGSFVNAGEPFCEDFNEFSLCAGVSSNTDACLNVPTTMGNWPTFETVCGDGQVDSYEECDDGTSNGPPPAACSTICRFNR